MLRFFVVAGALFALAGSGRSDEPAKSKESVKLDTKALGVMIADLGYEAKLQDNVFHNFKAQYKDKFSSVWVSVSSDTKRVRLFTEFTLRAGFDKAPAEAWRKIVEKNYDIAPSCFGLDEKGSRLTLHRSLPNADVTPAVLRKEITAFVETVWKNEDLWATANFLPAPSPEAQKVLDRVQGKWKVEAFTALGKAGAADAIGGFVFAFEKNQMVVTQNGKESLRVGVQLAVKGGAVTIDVVPASGAAELGLLKLDGDTLTICTGASGAPRPTKFASTESGKETLIALKRAKPEADK